MGHVGRLYQIATRLKRTASLNITFFIADYSSAADIVIGDEFEVVKIPIPQTKPRHPFVAFGNQMEEQFKTRKFDMIVHDGCPLRWMSTMRLPDCPRVFVTNAFLTGHFIQDTVQSRWFTQNLRKIVNPIRQEKALAPLKSAFELYDADRVLLSDLPELFPGLSKNLPGHFSFCGPIFWSPKRAIPKHIRGLSGFSLISMGSTGKRPIDDVFLKSLRAFTKSEHLIYAGHKANELKILSELDHAFKFLPLNRMLENADAVVTQGGSGSTYQALSQGVPIIAFPTHLNQQTLGHVVENAGLGICVGLDQSLSKLSDFDLNRMIQKTREMQPKFRTGGHLAVKAIQSILT